MVGACASPAPHPAADPAAPILPLHYQPLAAVPPAAEPPFDWRAANQALTGGGHAGHQH
jgi:hypothetical protein